MINQSTLGTRQPGKLSYSWGPFWTPLGVNHLTFGGGWKNKLVQEFFFSLSSGAGIFFRAVHAFLFYSHSLCMHLQEVYFSNRPLLPSKIKWSAPYLMLIVEGEVQTRTDSAITEQPKSINFSRITCKQDQQHYTFLVCLFIKQMSSHNYFKWLKFKDLQFMRQHRTTNESSAVCIRIRGHS